MEFSFVHCTCGPPYVTFFHQSTKASDKLKEVQNQIGNSEVKLVQKVETRWNSSFYMFKQVLEQKEAITSILCLLGKNEMCLSTAELKQLSMAVTILQPFETATTELSAETYVSVSKIIPIARSLQKVALSNDTSTSINKELVSQMRTCLSNIEGNTFLSKATLLDPRFKKLAFLNPVASNNSEELLLQPLSESLVSFNHYHKKMLLQYPEAILYGKHLMQELQTKKKQGMV